METNASYIWYQHYINAQRTDTSKQCLQNALTLAEHHYPPHCLCPQSGELLMPRLFATAQMVGEMNLLDDAVAATILNCLPHYLSNWQQIITEQCGQSVCNLVHGINEVEKLTQLTRVDKFNNAEERAAQAETMRKMLLAMVNDIRVVLIKLALRTRTMQYLVHTPDNPNKRILANETLDIFAPLANRLGVWQLKWQLEDLGFRFQNPEQYRRIATLLDEKRDERLQYIDHFLNDLRQQMDKTGIHYDVAGRPKHIYSIYKKMMKKKLDFEGLYDIRAVRILVDSIAECYTTLGIIHSLWQPIPGEFDDYIANPKGNGYKSLHTVIIGPQDKGIEVQIRTFEMHQFNEFGVAAHWRYKEGGKGDSAYEQKIAWLRQLLDWRENIAENNNRDLTSAFQTELFNDTIYVLTPHGKVLSLPKGSTPIDFAYALHTHLGDCCRGAKVNGEIVPLSTALENGQRVEIIAVKEGSPSVNWLHEGWVKSHRAISKIRAFIRQQNAETLRNEGKHQFEKAIAKSHTKPNQQHLCEKLGFKTLDELYSAVGQGELSPHTIQKACYTLIKSQTPTNNSNPLIKKSKIKTHNHNGILINGEEGLLTNLARCCKPAPPDNIMGFVTRERGISIHRYNCPDLQYLITKHPEKILSATWDQQHNDSQIFAIDIGIQAQDRSGLLRDISDTLARHKINVTAVQTQSRYLQANLRFTLEVKQVEDLPRVLANLAEIHGVDSVSRL